MSLALFKAFQYSMQRQMVFLVSFYAYIFQDLNMALFFFYFSNQREDSKCIILYLNANVRLNVTEGSWWNDLPHIL